MREPLRVLDLFSGIGGFSLGLERAGGFKTAAFCEIDQAARVRLARHWPGIPIYDDIRELTAATLRRDGIAVDVICGGFPCQDISTANPQGAGIDGERSGLWSEYRRLIRELRPECAIVENSAALLYRGLGKLLGQLAEIGYDAEWHCLRASSIGCPFEGDRIYILATPNAVDGKTRLGLRSPILDAGKVQLAYLEYRASVWLETTCRSARMGHGFSDYVDRRERTELVGNSVVSQIIETIGKAYLERESRLATDYANRNPNLGAI